MGSDMTEPAVPQQDLYAFPHKLHVWGLRLQLLQVYFLKFHLKHSKTFYTEGLGPTETVPPTRSDSSKNW